MCSDGLAEDHQEEGIDGEVDGDVVDDVVGAGALTVPLSPDLQQYVQQSKVSHCFQRSGSILIIDFSLT